jgi:hypothetical protein
MSTANNSPSPPRLIPGVVYSTQDILKNLRIGKDTLTNWRKKGLMTILIDPKKHMYLSDDVINFLRTLRGEATCDERD